MLSPLLTTPVAQRLGVPSLTPAAVTDLARLGIDEQSPEGLVQSMLEAGARAGIS